MRLSEVNPTALYPVVIPSSKKKAKYRPFRVKEERALLHAQQSGDLGVMLTTLKQVVENCIEPEGAAEGLTSYDLEYLFTLIRAKSVGEFSDLVFNCDHCDAPNAKAKVSVDLRNVEVHSPEGFDKKIKLSENITVVMRIPSMEELIEIQGDGSEGAVIRLGIETIYVDDDVYHAKEETKEELDAFIESLSSKQYTMLEDFFESMPFARIPIKYKCPACGADHNKFVKGLNNFF